MAAIVQAESKDISISGMPVHVAIIMDGNGRWAAERGLPRAIGHKNGSEAVRKAIEGALVCGVKYLTLYAFSSENWERPKSEVQDLMGLLRFYLKKEVAALDKEGVCIRIIGRRDRLDPDIVTMIETAESKTKTNKRLTLVIALNYGGRDDIIDAVSHIARSVAEGREKVEDITEERFSQALSTRDIPDPDLIIRTSGEQRLSNFLMWQSAYAELMFLDLYWPDFTSETFKQSIQSFQLRDRRFGKRKAG